MFEIEFEQNNNEGFGTLLNTDMKVDLANYLKEYAGDKFLIDQLQILSLLIKLIL